METLVIQIFFQTTILTAWYVGLLAVYTLIISCCYGWTRLDQCDSLRVKLKNRGVIMNIRSVLKNGVLAKMTFFIKRYFINNRKHRISYKIASDTITENWSEVKLSDFNLEVTFFRFLTKWSWGLNNIYDFIWVNFVNINNFFVKTSWIRSERKFKSGCRLNVARNRWTWTLPKKYRSGNFFN